MFPTLNNNSNSIIKLIHFSHFCIKPKWTNLCLFWINVVAPKLLSYKTCYRKLHLWFDFVSDDDVLISLFRYIAGLHMPTLKKQCCSTNLLGTFLWEIASSVFTFTSIYIVLVTLVAAAMPFFGDFVSICGAIYSIPESWKNARRHKTQALNAAPWLRNAILGCVGGCCKVDRRRHQDSQVL